MKTSPQLTSKLAIVALVAMTAFKSAAGIFTWSAPTPITTADTTLNQSGTVVGAACFGAYGRIVTLSSGATIDFKADGSVATATGTSIGYAGFTNDTGNANFNFVLTGYSADGGPKTITLNNLTVGQQYSVQLFACDRRSGIRSSLIGNYQDPLDAANKSANFAMGDYAYVIGTFTASATTQGIQMNLLNSNGGNINALVIRVIGSNVPPQITSQPQAATVYKGLTARFTSAVIGSGTLSYQWQKSSVGGGTFTNLSNGARISGATAAALSISNLVAGDTGDYRLVVSSTYGSVTSSLAATLTVLTGTPQFTWSAPAAITSADAVLNQSGTVVGAAVFGTTDTTVTLTNSSVITFKADGSVAAVTVGGNGTGTGAYLGNTGNANFDGALTQFNFDGGPKTISLFNLIPGQQYSVQLFAIDNRPSNDGETTIRQANFQDPADPYNVSDTFTLADSVYVMGTFYASNSTVDIQQNLPINNNGNINALVVRALGVIVAPSITTPPASVTINQGLSVRMSVVASGTAPLTYQWQRGALGSGIFTNVPANVRFSGINSSSLTITNLALGDAADYQVVVVNAGGSATSTPPATLTVVGVTPQFVWSVPAPITTADATLNQAGTIVGAAVFGPTPTIVVLTNGTSVDFQTNDTVATTTGAGITTGAFTGDTGNAAFNSVLNQFNFDNGPKTITVNGLVAGQQYAVQLFALDDRSGANTRTANFQDPSDANDYSITFAMPDNVYTIASFTAAASSVSIQENLFGTGGNINALVIRRLSGLPLAPQISTQPKATTVFSGTTAQFTVGANGTALTYQWQAAPISGGTYTNLANGNGVSGVTTAQLTIASAASANVANYRVVVSNGSGSVTSSSATLSVRPTVAVLKHRWSFNETSGTTAADSIGGANGTLVSGSGTTASFVNGMVLLSNPSPQTTGAGSYVSIPGGLVSSLSAVTIQTWVTNSGLNNGNTLIGFGGTINGSGEGTNFINFFLRWPSSRNGFRIATDEGDSGNLVLGTRQQAVYVHWTWIYDPIASSVRLYQNGNLVETASASVPLSSVDADVGFIGYSAWNQVVGTAIPTTSGNFPYYNGYVDELRIYDGVLNTNGIAAAALLGANQLLSDVATLSIARSGNNVVLTWPIVNGAFMPESSPVLGANAVWTPVSGTKTVVGANYQMTVPASSSAAFFRLKQ